MDVLRPKLIFIGNRCYRKYPVTTHICHDAEEREERGAACDVDEYADESCTIGIDDDIRTTSNGFQLVMRIPSYFYKHIIGKKGETRKRLETETKTQIKIPKQNEIGDIVITGSNRAGVKSARTRIDILTSTARRRVPFTHFLSLPVNDGGVKLKFDEFKQLVLKHCKGDRGIDETIFQNRYKLHLTVGTMALLDDVEVDLASVVLEDCRQELVSAVLEDKALRMKVCGLEYMNDDPTAVDVLYAKVCMIDKSNRLQTFVDRLVEKFVAAGVMNREYSHVKLHITVMNSLMRKDPSGTTVTQSHDHPKERVSFDATRVLELFKDYDFGECHLQQLHISQRSSTSPDAYYTPSATVALP